MRLVLRPDGRLEVESEIGSDPEDSIVSVHVEATLVMKSGGWVKANRPEQDGFDLNQLRTQCPQRCAWSCARMDGLRWRVRSAATLRTALSRYTWRQHW
mmetsp:Transcript_72241/g.169301  ORF Transcript_72241/g.169301 Transcript_72241/m.169301 type:complete len:99 (-) Transcript_72241:49-345(-)